MENITSNVWLITIIILFMQMAFLYLRTLNIIYTANRKILASIITNNLISIIWLFSVFIGIQAIMSMEWQPIVGYILGNTIGTYLGFINKKK